MRHTPHDHVPNRRRHVLLHDVLEGPQEVLLESEVRELPFLDELHGQLSQAVHGKEGYVLIRTATHGVEVLAQNLPDSRPLQTDPAHVVVGDLDDFLEREHARVPCVRKLIQRHLEER